MSWFTLATSSVSVIPVRLLPIYIIQQLAIVTHRRQIALLVILAYSRVLPALFFLQVVAIMLTLSLHQALVIISALLMLIRVHQAAF